ALVGAPSRPVLFRGWSAVRSVAMPSREHRRKRAHARFTTTSASAPIAGENWVDRFATTAASSDKNWPAIREQLLRGTYQPQPVRRVEIAKPDGGVRKLGIPMVLDRFVQQALMQVLQRRWDP